MSKDFDAALSAQSTGSAGVAAEPVAWVYEQQHPDGAWTLEASRQKPGSRKWFRNIRPLYEHPPVAAEPVAWLNERIVTAERNRDGYEVGTASEAFFSGHIAAYMDALGMLTRFAAAPTPPAGGGETDDGDMASPAYWRRAQAEWLQRRKGEGDDDWISRLRRHFLNLSHLTSSATVAEPSPASPAGDLNSLSAVLKTLRDGFNSDDQQIKNWSLQTAHDRIAALAPAAPRKGPSEEEILAILNSKIHARSSLITGAYLTGVEGAAHAIATLLTPADRGETQAVGDGADV